MKPALLIGPDTHRELGELLRAKGKLTISGASNETAKSLLLSHLLSFRALPTVLVTEDETHVESLNHWMTFFGRTTQSFPMPDEDGVLTTEALQRFLLFMRGEGDVFIAPRAVWDMPFPLYTDLEERAMTLKKGDTLPFIPFVEELLERGYQHAEDQHLSPGEYRRVGDVLEIFPVQMHHAVRIAASMLRRAAGSASTRPTHPRATTAS